VTEFEGGLRQSAFVAGGFLPAKMRGKTTNALMHICDWYATFASLAGVDPNDAGKPGGVPASDGLDLWPVIAGLNGTSPRTSAALTAASMLVSDGDHLWKYIAHQAPGHDAAWVGPEYPDGKVIIGPICNPCLFDVQLDPEERHDQSAAQPALTAQLAALLGNETHFQTGSGADRFVGEYQSCVSVSNFTATHRGFLGPVCEKGPPLPPPPPPPPQPPPPPAVCTSTMNLTGYQCIQDVCASDPSGGGGAAATTAVAAMVSGGSCAHHINPDHKHGCPKGDWKCAVPASAKVCEAVSGCVSFSLSPKNWDDVKLYFGNATLVPNSDWNLWKRDANS
jgi:hypothetical protein